MVFTLVESLLNRAKIPITKRTVHYYACPDVDNICGGHSVYLVSVVTLYKLIIPPTIVRLVKWSKIIAS